MDRASGSVSETCRSGGLVQLLFDSAAAHLRLHRDELVLEVLDPLCAHQAGIAVGAVELREVALHTLVELLHACLELALGEVFVPVVHRLELAPVNGHRGLLEQTESPTQQDELSARAANGLAVVLAEVGDGFEIGHQSPGEPDQFYVALRLSLQPSAGLDAVQVPVDVDLEQRGRVIRRPACLGGLGALESPGAPDPARQQRHRPHAPGCLHRSSRPVAQETGRFECGPVHRCIGPLTAPSTRQAIRPLRPQIVFTQFRSLSASR